MPFTLLPFTPLDVTAAEAAALIAPLNASGVLLSNTNSETWTRWILEHRNAGALSLAGALFLQRYVVEQTGMRSPAAQWANLSVIECLGQVNSDACTVPLLRHLIINATGLHYQVLTGGLKNATTLRNSVLARKNAGKTIAGPTGLVFLVYLDRIGDALTPYLIG